jgi:hypothetical protein
VGWRAGLGYASAAVRPRWLVAVAALATLGPVLTACQATSPYAAIVDGTHISESQLLRELNAFGDNSSFVNLWSKNIQQSTAQGQAVHQPVFATDAAEPTFTADFAAFVLGDEVNALAIHAADVRLHIEPPANVITSTPNVQAAEAAFGTDPAVFKLFNPWFRHMFEVRTAEAANLGNQLAKDPALVKSFYIDNPQYFITAECVSQILVGTEGEALSLRGKIERGSKFATLAKKYSTDAASAAKGGSIGCNGLGNFAVTSFAEVADTVQVGQVSEPVHSQFGWHLILVTSRQLQKYDTQTQTGLTTTLQQQPYFVFLAGAPVTINPAYGSWDPLQLTVTPPVAPGPGSGAITPTTVAGDLPLTPSGGSSGSSSGSP